MLKKALSIFFILTIIFNMTEVYIVFRMERAFIRHSIKQQIKKGIPEDELHHFSFSESDYKQLEWIRPDKEFRIRAEMFDVVRVETKGDSVYLSCVNDKEEAILFAQLDEFVQKKMEQESNAPNSLINKVIKVLKLVYVYNPSSIFFNFHLDKHHNFKPLKSYCASPYLEVLKPPPDIV